ncbi:exported hypothetical protein [uncultured spirochete]|jgi:hypothetical protein|uniref:Lipoprotein n=1 Tax=uncultured spirochete TaxID=156406 RepID=A0A3P3XM20_9SPIR|nr:hypothetical protein [Rectinema subterraneum]SLM15971.1 exported hypothetical protein [uncultured spirochete]
MITYKTKRIVSLLILTAIFLITFGCSEPIVYRTILLYLTSNYGLFSTGEKTDAKIYSISDGYITTLKPGDMANYTTYVGDRIIAIYSKKVNNTWVDVSKTMIVGEDSSVFYLD